MTVTTSPECPADHWLAQAGIRLEPEEAGQFLEAAQVLLPPELELAECRRAGSAPTARQREALLALWAATGAQPPAAVPMPLHPLAPGVMAEAWRRVREALWRMPRPAAQ